MSSPVSTLAWFAALAVVAIVLVVVKFESQDPDSSTYARIGTGLAARPASQWIAPRWSRAAGSDETFREHPVGVFLPTALLGKLGAPPMQAAFIVGLACSIAVLLMLQHVAALIVGSRKAAVVPWVALMLPAAFVNRVRATQEYPVLALMLLAIYATERSRTSWRWIGVVIAAACATTLVKGVFIVFVPIVCGLWILCVRENRHGDLRAWIGLVLSMAAVIAGTFAYEALYSRVTGDSFLGYYMPYRVGQISVAAQDVTTLVTGKLDNIGWYSARLLWFAFPGSLALLIAVWRKRPAGPGPNRLRQGSGGQEGPGLQGLLFALGAAGAYVAVMSFGATRSERFIFPAYFSIGIAGALVATRRWRFAANLETRAARARPYALPLAWLLLVLAALPFEMYVPYVKIR